MLVKITLAERVVKKCEETSENEKRQDKTEEEWAVIASWLPDDDDKDDVFPLGTRHDRHLKKVRDKQENRKKSV